MLVGVQLRHYKTYKNVKYIPVSNKGNFSVYIGDNGVGKTSVLGAFDSFFNQEKTKNWNINLSAKDDGLGKTNKPYIVPVFLIKKSEISGKNNIEIATKLNDFFRVTDFTSSTPELKKFYEHRKKILEKSDGTHYFISIGRRYEDKNAYFGMFDSTSELKEFCSENQEKVNSFLNYIVQMYNYIYLPVDIDINNFTKLEKKNMNILMDKNINQTIKEIVKDLNIDNLNTQLDAFLETVEKGINEFTYKQTGRKRNFTKNDLIEKIIETYFSTKFLHKNIDGYLVSSENLSSGEKRKALVEILLSFLKIPDGTIKKNQKIIVAIDEPEASLHNSNCYNQFEKLFNLSERGNQIIATSHWYGFLPTIYKGNAINITKQKSEFLFNVIDLGSYREQLRQETEEKNGNLPYDINIKSFNDLIQSIVFSLQKEAGYNWIICEGYSEKIYFEYYFKNEIENNNFKILSAGGSKGVKKIYEYLTLPLKELNIETKDILGKVFCLIDTDEQRMKFETIQGIKRLEFKRLLTKEGKVSLENIDSTTTFPPTEIEDCLDSNFFHETLKTFKDSDAEIEKILNENEFDKDSVYSRNFMDLRVSEKIKVKSFFNKNKGENKIKFAQKYVEILVENEDRNQLKWIEDIKKYFSNK